MNKNLIEGILSNNHQSIAKAISIIENNNDADVESLLSGIYSKTGKAYRTTIRHSISASPQNLQRQENSSPFA